MASRFLSGDERTEIADRRHTGETIQAIATAIGRSPSTANHELRTTPQRHRAGRRHLSKPIVPPQYASDDGVTKLVAHPELLAGVKELLAQRWPIQD
ncbi:helix-turn-helix domain-containing protein [[Mycobacterium] burgundiense]|uniref:helix-turn-helix domain-containing protein n=1 Tax=[Mycobacterium] burgundiense TaxID=3064286 RepID=UPI00359F23DB